MKHELTDIFLKSAFQILVTEFVMNSYIQLLCFDKKALFYSYKFFLTNDFEIHFPVANYFKFKKYMRLRSFITIGENYFFCYWKLERVFQKQLLNLLSSMTPFFVSIKKKLADYWYFVLISMGCYSNNAVQGMTYLYSVFFFKIHCPKFLFEELFHNFIIILYYYFKTF